MKTIFLARKIAFFVPFAACITPKTGIILLSGVIVYCLAGILAGSRASVVVPINCGLPN